MQRWIPLVCVPLALLSQAAAAPPNVVVILSDDQAWTDYGFMEHPVVKTPNLDELAVRSAVFARGHVPTALCRPSLLTLISGLYSHQHLTGGNDPLPIAGQAKGAAYDALREQLISHVDKVPTLPKLLGAQGYVSFQSGKWWEGNYSRGGFTEGMTRGFPQPGGRHGDDGLTIGREGLQPVFQFIDKATEAKKPFFVWYAPILPHTPHNPPEALLRKYYAPDRAESVAKYFAMIEWFDETCGQLLDHIDQKGLRENTIIVYLADNGWIQDASGPRYAPKSKQSPNEGGVRTPILVSWPTVIQPGGRPETVSSIDLAPTILAAAGVEKPAEMQGLNLLPAIQLNKPLEREAIFGEGYDHDIPDLDDPEKALLYRWVIEGNWKLILTYDGAVSERYASSHPRTEKRPQLFDLSKDPFEDQNVAKQHPEIVERLAGRIQNWYPLKERRAITVWTE